MNSEIARSYGSNFECLRCAEQARPGGSARTMSCPARTGCQMVGRSSADWIGRLSIETHPPTGLAGHGIRTVRRCTGHGLGYEMRSVETDDAPHTEGGPGRRARHRALFVLSRPRSEPSRLDRGPRRFLARAHWPLLPARRERSPGRPLLRTGLHAKAPRSGLPCAERRCPVREHPVRIRASSVTKGRSLETPAPSAVTRTEDSRRR